MKNNYKPFAAPKLFSFKRAGLGFLFSLFFSLVCSSVLASPKTLSDSARDSIHLNSQLTGVYVAEGTTIYGFENITSLESKKAVVKVAAVKKQSKPKVLPVKKEIKQEQKQILCICKKGETPKDYLESAGHNNKVTTPSKYERAKAFLNVDFQELYFWHFEYTSVQNDVPSSTVSGKNIFYHFTRPPPSFI